MKKVRFAQKLEVELWVDIDVPDDFTDADVEEYVQEFRFEVTVTENGATDSNEHANTDIYVHWLKYAGDAEVMSIVSKAELSE